MSTGTSFVPNGISGLYVTGDYSDCKVICGDYEYNLHKAIICSQSGFFKAAFKDETKEAITSSVYLTDDDHFAIERMMDYFYHGDYGVGYVKSHSSESDDETIASGVVADLSDHDITSCWNTDSCNACRSRDTLNNNGAKGTPADVPAFTQHIYVYIVADKYDVPALKTLAYEKFHADTLQAWDSNEFMDSVEELYLSSPLCPSDSALKYCVLRIIVARRKLILRPRIMAVLKYTGLGMDVLKHLADDKYLCPTFESERQSRW